ncbi:MAG: hypothetical protein D6708_12160 [Candidatus Dadabacteria bacterium]|nr:MAG: hypothetical protein D6708_12160 [Candidatus Dadabacteria bacterium]
MNTQSHAILTTAVVRAALGRRGRGVPRLNVVVALGALAPDLPIFGFFFWATFVERLPQGVIWGEVYFRPGWQALVSAFHSFPLWAALAGVALWRGWARTALFAGAGFLASLEDFFLHNEDAHAHFWPFSDYRFRSPVSYWDPAHHGVAASLAETAAVLAATWWLWPRVETRWGRAVLAVAALSLLGNHALWSAIFAWL